MDRRALWMAVGASTMAGLAASDIGRTEVVRGQQCRPCGARTDVSRFIQARDGTSLFYKDWGKGPPVLFVAPWALPSEWWEYQMADLAGRGLRCIAYDRRGHGRSAEPGKGYEFDTLADDLTEVVEQLDLRDLTLVGHSMGCAEIVRYLSRQPVRRVARAVLIGTTTPSVLKTAENPAGFDESVLEMGRRALARDRPHQVAIAAPSFFGAPPNAVSPEVMDWWVRLIVDQCSLKVMLDLHRVFTRTDFSADLRKINVPVLLVHGNRDTSAPIDVTARRTVPLIPRCELKVYEDAAHGLPISHIEQLNAELPAFART
jgi:non-heme chloroperoxidase